MFGRVWGVVVAMMVLVAAEGQAAPTDLVPHRAVYSMSLASIRSGAGIVGAKGTMTYEFDDSCDGWVIENRIAITYAYAEGGPVSSTTDFITWEAKNGLHYKYRLRNTRDGEITEDIEGVARLRGKGKGGEAKYSRPDTLKIPLPRGTLFPTGHTLRLLDAARSGEHIFGRVVFDGSDVEGPYEIHALIGNKKPVVALASNGPMGTEDNKIKENPLLATPLWPVRLAYFSLNGNESVPDFEMALSYHPNGVSQNVMQSFKNFSLSGTLVSLEELPKKRCR